MAVLVLSGKTVSTEDFGSYFKTFVNLRADAVIFDYKSQTIVRSYPLSVILFDTTPQKPNTARITKIVDDLIRHEDSRGLGSQFALHLQSATLPKKVRKQFRLAKKNLQLIFKTV